MIQMPRRSVTRFFIPLIDVLTLMFCIFLIMPMVKPAEERSAFNALAAREERIRQLEQELKKQGKGLNKEQQKELEKLREEFARSLQQRLVIRLLSIDGQTGELYYHDDSDRRKRIPIDTEKKAVALIDADRRREGSKHEMYYLILYPREANSPFPLVGDRERFDQWFSGAPHGYDVPGSGPARGDVP
jgi:hypothetical protein